MVKEIPEKMLAAQVVEVYIQLPLSLSRIDK